MIQRSTSTHRKVTNSKDQNRWRSLTFIAIIGFILSIGLIYSESNPSAKSSLSFYLNLANPYVKFVVINPGMRIEEIADKIGKSITWTDADKLEFINSAPKDDYGIMEGFFMPGSYWIKIDATGKEVAEQGMTEFNKQVSEKVLGDKKIKSSAQKINLETAVRIASIIQREAAGPKDMNLISGVIWNRLLVRLPLFVL